MTKHPTIYVHQRIEEYQRYWAGAAKVIGADFVPLNPGVWEIKVGQRSTRIANYITEADGPVTLQLAGDKAYCHQVAAACGVPTAVLGVFTHRTIDQAVEALEGSEGAMVVKPTTGSSSGLGITMDIGSKNQLIRAAALSSFFSDSFILERFVVGESYRLVFVDNTFVHAVRRRGVHVRGDGQSSLADLMHADAELQPEEPVVQATLVAQGLGSTSIPLVGQDVLVRWLPIDEFLHPEHRTVYNETVTDLVGPELRDEAGEVVRALGARFAGVDVITTDPSLSLRSSGGAFLEVNTTPGIHHHYHTRVDHEQHPVAAAVLRMLLVGPESLAVPSGVETYPTARQ